VAHPGEPDERCVDLVDEVRRANGAPLADDVAVLFVAPQVRAPVRK